MIQIILSVMVGIIAVAYFGYINYMNKNARKNYQNNRMVGDFIDVYSYFQFNDIEHTFAYNPTIIQKFYLNNIHTIKVICFSGNGFCTFERYIYYDSERDMYLDYQKFYETFKKCENVLRFNDKHNTMIIINDKIKDIGLYNKNTQRYLKFCFNFSWCELLLDYEDIHIREHDEFVLRNKIKNNKREYFEFNDLDHTIIYGITGISKSDSIDEYYIDIVYHPTSGLPNVIYPEEKFCKLKYFDSEIRNMDYYNILSKIIKSNKKVFENLKKTRRKRK